MSLDDKRLRHLADVFSGGDDGNFRYRIVERVGAGGMGTVYRAFDTILDREVALKVIETKMGKSFEQRFHDEARIMAQIEHPGIIPVHDLGSLDDGRPYYAMKLVRGRRLDEFREEGHSLNDLLRIFLTVCETLSHAHSRGVIHRDLKPANIMVGEFGAVHVLDWGLAKAVTAPSDYAKTDQTGEAGQENRESTQHGTVMGTPAYMAPEQAKGQIANIDTRTDVYSLCAVLFFLLTGQPPFSGSSKEDLLNAVMSQEPRSPKQLEPSVPKPLERICMAGLKKNPTKRYQSVVDLTRDITAYLDSSPVSVYREPISERIARWAHANRFLIYIVLSYLAMRLLILFWPSA